MTWKRAHRKVIIDCSLLVQMTVDRIPADLLLPVELLTFAVRLKENSGEWRDLIAYLVNRHRARILRIADTAGNLRFHYQEKGLNLKRICYLPYRDTIAELRILSYASRISMSALVVMMIEWERQSTANIELDCFLGVPIMFESGWTKVGAILTVTGAIQMPVATHPPPGYQ